MHLCVLLFPVCSSPSLLVTVNQHWVPVCLLINGNDKYIYLMSVSDWVLQVQDAKGLLTLPPLRLDHRRNRVVLATIKLSLSSRGPQGLLLEWPEALFQLSAFSSTLLPVDRNTWNSSQWLSVIKLEQVPKSLRRQKAVRKITTTIETYWRHDSVSSIC